MKNYFIQLKIKIRTLQSSDPGSWKIKCYKLILVLLKYLVVITHSAGFSFPLIFQTQGARSVPYSYKEFKIYQFRIRTAACLLLLALVIVIKKIV